MTDIPIEATTGATPPVFRYAVAAAVLVGLVWWSWSLYDGDGVSRALSVSLLAGTAFGVVLQRSRFCFYCNFREFWEDGDPRGVYAILIALAVGFVLTQVVITSWMPVPGEGRLPANAHVGPVSPALALGALVFGVGMAVSGSCISAHLYRLGEGSPTAPFALIGAAVGFVLGFLAWNDLYLAVIVDWPVVWLPHTLGYAGTVALTLAALGVLFLAVALMAKRPPAAAPQAAPQGLGAALKRIFVDRWSAWAGGVAVGVIAMVAYFRVAPIGVTAELGSLARTGAGQLALLPETLYGLDGFRGCATVVKEALLSNNGLFVIGLIGGSFSAALPAGQFRPALPTGGQVFRGLLGGALMGFGAMVSLGCTVGVLLSGIHAGALSGWVFLVFCVAGTILGMAVMRRVRR